MTGEPEPSRSKEAEPSSNLSQVIERIAGALAIKPARRPAFRYALEQLGAGHAFVASLVRDPRTGKERRAHLDRLGKSLAEALEHLETLHIATKVSLTDALQSSRSSKTNLISFERDLKSFYEAVQVLQGHERSAGPRADAALNHLVGALTLAILQFTGQRPTAYRSDADGTTRQVFGDKQAEAIRDVVRCLEPGCSDVTIVNQIMKVRRGYTDEQLRATFEPALMSLRVTGHYGPNHA